jgi:hypothetical protein
MAKDPKDLVPKKTTPAKTTTTKKSPIGPGSGYLQPTKPAFDPKSLTLSNAQIVKTIQQRGGTTTTGTGTGTGTKVGGDKGGGDKGITKPLTFKDVDNGDGTITRTYSDGSVEIIAGGRGAGGDSNIAYENWLAQQDLKERTSAFKVLEDTFNRYGLGTLAPKIKEFLIQGLSEDEAIIQLRQTPEYQTRFLGNEGRRAKGLAAYDEATYLNAEQTYRDILAQAGLDTLATADTFSKLIGGAVSAAETQDRIQNVFNKIDNADPQLKQQLGNYLTGYGVSDPNLQRTQLASALLTGGTSAQELVRSIEKAQIKTAALTAGVNIAEENVTNLQKQLESAKTYDVYGTAKKAFGEIAATEPTLTKLANIYGEDAAALQPELQQEAFFGLASQRRKKLQEKEQATFSGQAGTSTVSLAQERPAGQF